MVRFYLIILFFLISLLALFKAPEYNLWLLAIGVTEFPLLFAGITTLLTLWGFWVQKYQLAGTVLGIITLVIYLSPIFIAFFVAKKVKTELPQVFNIKPIDAAPFSISNIFSGTKLIASKPIT